MTQNKDIIEECFNPWNDATGVFQKGTGYYFEMESILEDCINAAREAGRREMAEEIYINLSESIGLMKMESNPKLLDAQATLEIITTNLKSKYLTKEQ